mmetsp:Transcript_27503/g.44757  ORF Transcript_27503/g.44757 Transcript_27503/m.44757 type:complete len:422 (+) Transcript_27503:257-1522(+)
MASLRDHFRSHTREKPYVCNVCNKKYSFRGSLSLHRRKHSGSRFHCLTCLRNFTQKSTLQYHMLAVHKRVRDNVCEICGLKSFSRATDCRRHMRSHIDSRPYVCTNCSRGFREKCHLLVHQRIHTGEKPFICGQCGFAFSDAANHAKHVRRRSCFFYANNNNNNNNLWRSFGTLQRPYTMRTFFELFLPRISLYSEYGVLLSMFLSYPLTILANICRFDCYKLAESSYRAPYTIHVVGASYHESFSMAIWEIFAFLLRVKYPRCHLRICLVGPELQDHHYTFQQKNKKKKERRMPPSSSSYSVREVYNSQDNKSGSKTSSNVLQVVSFPGTYRDLRARKQPDHPHQKKNNNRKKKTINNNADNNLNNGHKNKNQEVNSNSSNDQDDDNSSSTTGTTKDEEEEKRNDDEDDDDDDDDSQGKC